MTTIDAPFAAARSSAPLSSVVELKRLFPRAPGRVFLALETSGATGSVKDLAARSILDAAENLGLINTESEIVDSSAGGWGVALASECAARGMRAVVVAPESADESTLRLLERLGAEIVRTSARSGMTGANREARRLAEERPNAWTPDIFSNPANAACHETKTGPDLLRGLGGRIDAFVCGVGTGGTFTGVSRYLRRACGSVELVAVEPRECAVLSGGAVGAHGIIGLGAGFAPRLFDRELPTAYGTVSTSEAEEWRDALAKTEGILVGISTGANLAVAARLAESRDYLGKTIATIAFSRG